MTAATSHYPCGCRERGGALLSMCRQARRLWQAIEGVRCGMDRRLRWREYRAHFEKKEHNLSIEQRERGSEENVLPIAALWPVPGEPAGERISTEGMAPLVPARLVEARKARCWTQKTLAGKLGHGDAGDVEKWETGRRSVSKPVLLKLSKLLGVTPAFLCGEDEPEVQPQQPQAAGGDAAVPSRITLARLAAGMDTVALGRAIGVTGEAVRSWEKGRNRLSGWRLGTVARILKVSLEYLRGETEIPDRQDAGESTRLVPEVLRDLRIQRGWTQQQMAEAINVSRNAVTGWEQGIYAPSGTRLAELAEALGVSEAVLAGQEEARVELVPAPLLFEATFTAPREFSIDADEEVAEEPDLALEEAAPAPVSSIPPPGSPAQVRELFGEAAPAPEWTSITLADHLRSSASLLQQAAEHIESLEARLVVAEAAAEARMAEQRSTHRAELQAVVEMLQERLAE